MMTDNSNDFIFMQNRELSWLKFNERVLDEASDPTVHLMERLKFISIFTRNLDEFFMIRVGSLYDLSLLNPEYTDKKSGMTADVQLSKIFETVRFLYKKQYGIYCNVMNSLKNFSIVSLEYGEMTKGEQDYIKTYYDANIEPIISPQIVDVHHPFPFLPNKTIYILALLKRKNQEVIGLLPIPEMVPDIIFLPGNGIRFIKTEKILFHFADKVFKKYQITEKNIICVTRNADIRLEETSCNTTDDFRDCMVELLKKRKKLNVVRLEAGHSMSAYVKSFLCKRLNIDDNQIFTTASDLKMDYVFSLFSKLSRTDSWQLTYPRFIPSEIPDILMGKSLISQIKSKDLLLFYPYQKMNTFLQLIKEAACDPKVISIKITIYRLSSKSKLVDYLCDAAENGKDVTAVLELRARFDESNNIDWSEKLEDSGCKILYGLENYKVHSKVCLITLKEKNEISYITQIGTGNYNEKTAELYTDFSLITADKGVGTDAGELFKNLSIGNREGNYKKLLVAPGGLKTSLMMLIESEIKKGSNGRIIIKINSLTDVDFIKKLAEASVAGVKTDLIVRGICCILPGIAGKTDNINVRSIVGRYLEHSRIYSFGEGENQLLYISSADLMTRNTERRIEVACPVYDNEIKKKINHIINIILQDNVKARLLQSNGEYTKILNNEAPIDSQQSLIQEYSEVKTNSINSKKSKYKGIIGRLFTK